MSVLEDAELVNAMHRLIELMQVIATNMSELLEAEE